MPTSEAQKRASRNYYVKCMDDPVKREKLLNRMRENAKKRSERIKVEKPEEIEYNRIRASDTYYKWKKRVQKEEPEKYREYLFNSRVKYWNKLRETKTAKEYDKAINKCKVNNPTFYEKLIVELEKLKSQDI